MTKLDEILTAANASNHDLVEQLPEHLNHKMVQKARLGKRAIPRHTQDMLIVALNKLLTPEKPYRREEVFDITMPKTESSALVSEPEKS
ncbi:MAG: hypothetical protein MJY47_03175 [Fibrobacter sp.]|nr:hypothetical protein [Fibrobacter sp.]